MGDLVWLFKWAFQQPAAKAAWKGLKKILSSTYNNPVVRFIWEVFTNQDMNNCPNDPNGEHDWQPVGPNSDQCTKCKMIISYDAGSNSYTVQKFYSKMIVKDMSNNEFQFSGDANESYVHTFSGNTFSTKWGWAHGAIPNDQWGLANDQLRIHAVPQDWCAAQNTAKNILLQPAPPGRYKISTRLHFAPTSDFQQAGLVIFQDMDNYVRISMAHAGGRKIQYCKEINGQFSKVEVDFPGDDVSLLLVKNGNHYGSAYSADGARFERIDPYFGDNLNFNPTKVGIYACRGNSTSAIDAYFDHFSTLLYP